MNRDHSQFDHTYYERFYEQPETRASGPVEFQRLSDFVLSYLRYMEVEVREVLDLGCGLGRWKAALAAYDPTIRYTGVDPSPYLAEKFGWIRNTVEDFRSDKEYDLVICQDVLPYLARRGVKDALANIARMCGGAAYIQVVTKEDWENDVVDPDRTDHRMHRHDAEWFRKTLTRHFINCGGGVFVPKGGDTVLWEVEKIG